MTHLTFDLAAALYLAAAILGWRLPQGVTRAPALAIPLGLGAVSHALGFFSMHREHPVISLESFPAALVLIAWLMIIAYLLALRIAQVRAVGAWVALAAGLLTFGADLGLRFAEPPLEVTPGASSVWSHAHVLLSTAGFSLLTLSSLAGFAYLTKERALKRKRRISRPLPSLESLDRVGHFALSFGFPLLTLGMVTGFIWALNRGVGPWTTHAYSLLIAWAIYLFPIQLRVLRHQHGPRPARGVVLSFIVLAFSYIGIRLIGGGL